MSSNGELEERWGPVGDSTSRQIWFFFLVYWKTYLLVVRTLLYANFLWKTATDNWVTIEESAIQICKENLCLFHAFAVYLRRNQNSNGGKISIFSSKNFQEKSFSRKLIHSLHTHSTTNLPVSWVWRIIKFFFKKNSS